MLIGSQRELNSIDDQSGEGYVLVGGDAKTQTCIVRAHLNWRALPEMFVNNSRRSHLTWCAEDNA
jgi:hypothetical protein